MLKKTLLIVAVLKAYHGSPVAPSILGSRATAQYILGETQFTAGYQPVNPLWPHDCGGQYLCQVLYYPENETGYNYPDIKGESWNWAVSSLNRDCIVGLYLPFAGSAPNMDYYKGPTVEECTAIFTQLQQRLIKGDRIVKASYNLDV